MKFKLLPAVLVAFLSMALFSCGENEQDNQKKITRKIEVTGSAELEFVPNEIYMSFTINEYLKGGKKIHIEDVKAEFLASCKEAGIATKDISISSYSGNERYDYYWYYRRKSEPDFMGTISYSVLVNSVATLDKLVESLNEES